MAAAAFTATLVLRGSKGTITHQRCTVSDVAAAYWIFPSGDAFYQLPSDEAWYLVDVIVVTGGTDCTNSELFVNQKSAGLYIDHKSNLNTSNQRQFTSAPVGFKPGAQIKLVQRA